MTDRIFDGNRNLTSESIYYSDNASEKYVTEWTYGGSSQASSRKRKKADGTYATTTYVYYPSGEHAGLLQKEIDPCGGETMYEYTGGGDAPAPKGLVKRMFDSQREVSYTYDANGYRTSMVDGLERTTNYTHDSTGRLTSQNNPDGSQEIRTYVGTELVEIKTGSASQGYRITRFSYNGLNQRTEVLRVDGAQEVTQSEMDYDSEGHLLEERNALGEATTYSYDVRGSSGELVGADIERGHGDDDLRI